MIRHALVGTAAFLILLPAAPQGFGKPSDQASVTVPIATGSLTIPIPSDLMQAPAPIFLALKSRAPSAVRLLAFFIGRDLDNPNQIDPCRCRTVTISTTSGGNGFANLSNFEILKTNLKKQLKTVAAKQASAATNLMQSTLGGGNVTSGPPVIFMDTSKVFAFYTKSAVTDPVTNKQATTIPGSVALLTKQTIIFIYPHYTVNKGDEKEASHAISWVKQEAAALVHDIESDAR